jgi:NAD(P)-dependent dehydrogenase (short-subunit alcohol dehydrogenase family)
MLCCQTYDKWFSMMVDDITDDGIRLLLANRRLLVIGGGSGIGLATAELIAGSSATMAIIDRNTEALSTIAPRLSTHIFSADVTDADRLRLAIDQAANALGGIDGLILTAGIGSMVPFAELDPMDWEKVIAVNLTGNFLACRFALQYLQENDHATIVTTASATGLLPSSPGLSAYAASKGGLIALSKALATELAPKIRVNCVCPGPVETPLLPVPFREAVKRPGSGYPMERAAEAAEVARLILFLTSHASSYVNGSTIAIDGGRTLH